ncbi:MAG: hypothetical protein ACRD5F_06240 [Candidatus Acidiferrales bacterium]
MKLARFIAVATLALSLAGVAAAQAVPAPAHTPARNEEFLRLADELLAEVSAHLNLPVTAPLKKSLRSREYIRDYVVKQFREEQTPEESRVDSLVLQKFGLIPKGFELETFLIDLLTEQIGGLYDPREQEFYILDELGEDAQQRLVIAHELVHALHDQHFKLRPWLDAAKPDDDAQVARHAAAEGAATLVMHEFMARNLGLPVTSARAMGDLTLLMRAQGAAGMASGPQMASAPPFIQDALVFPYLDGAIFAQKVLKAGADWTDFNRVFKDPPVSTQQIMHPELYLAGVAPEPVDLAAAFSTLPRGWKKLDENKMGEFGVHGVLKRFLGSERAAELAPAWAGDRYAAFDRRAGGPLLLIFRVRLNSEAGAVRFFGGYSEALEAKYTGADGFFRRPNFFAFDSDEGAVFLHCVAADCLIVEGADRSTFNAINRALGRPSAPVQPARSSKRRIAVSRSAAILPASLCGRDEGGAAPPAVGLRHQGCLAEPASGMLALRVPSHRQQS